MPLVRYSEVAALTVNTVGADILDDMLRVDENTLSHSLATGAMTMEAMQRAGCSEEIIAVGGVAGVLHDVGKFHPQIQQLMAQTEGQKFTADQVRLMRTHTARGFVSLARRWGMDALRDTPAMNAAAYTALMHHQVFSQETYTQSPYAGICHTVQLCDIAHARLLDERSYRTARDGVTYTPQQIGRQIIQQFTELPPEPDGRIIPVEALVLSWAEEATRRQDLSTLD